MQVDMSIVIDLAITDVFDAAQESLNLVASSTLPTNLKPLTLNMSKTALTLNRNPGGMLQITLCFSLLTAIHRLKCRLQCILECRSE